MFAFSSEVVTEPRIQGPSERVRVARVVAALEGVGLVAERRLAVEQVLHPEGHAQGLAPGVGAGQVPDVVGADAVVAVAVGVVVAAGVAIGQGRAQRALVPGRGQAVPPARHRAGRGEVAAAKVPQLVDVFALELLLVVVAGDVSALQPQPELAPGRGRQAVVEADVDAAGLELAQVGHAGDHMIDGAVGLAYQAVGVQVRVVEGRRLGELGDLVGDLDPPEIQPGVEPVEGLVDEPQGHVARGFRFQLGVAARGAVELLGAVAVADPAVGRGAAGAQPRVVVVGIGVGGEGRVVQLVQRRRAEALAVGAAQHQFLEGLEAERVLGIGGAAEVTVLVMADRRRQFQAVEHRHVEFGVLRLHAAIAGHAAVGVDAEALHIAGERGEVLVEVFLAVLAAQGQGRGPGAEPVADLAADPAVDGLDPADRRGVVAVHRVGRQQRAARRGLRAEGVDHASGDTLGHRHIVDVAAADGVDHLVLVVRGAEVVVPAGQVAVECQQQALAGVVVLMAPRADVAFAPVGRHRLARVEGEAARPRGDAVARVERRARVDLVAEQRAGADLGAVLVARPEVFEADLVIVAELAGGLGEGRGLFGFRHQVQVAPQALPADSVARQQSRRVAAGTGQRVGGVRALAPVGRRGGAGGVVQAPAGLVVVGVVAVLGGQALLLVVADHAEHVEAVLLQVADAPAAAEVPALAAAGMGRGVVAGTDLAAGQALLGDEVDHPADGVGAVQRRGTVAQHFHPVDGGEGNGVQVHPGAVDRVGRVVAQAPAVKQHQGLVRADPTQVGKGRAAAAGTHRTPGADRGLVGGNPVDQLFGGGHALLAQLLDPQHRDRHRGLGINPTDRGAGHFHPLQLSGGLGVRRGAAGVRGNGHALAVLLFLQAAVLQGQGQRLVPVQIALDRRGITAAHQLLLEGDRQAGLPGNLRQGLVQRPRGQVERGRRGPGRQHIQRRQQGQAQRGSTGYEQTHGQPSLH